MERSDTTRKWLRTFGFVWRILANWPPDNHLARIRGYDYPYGRMNYIVGSRPIKRATITTIVVITLGNLSCCTLGPQSSSLEPHSSYFGSSPALTPDQVKMVANAAMKMKTPTRPLGGSDPIAKTEIGILVPDLPARTQGADILDLLPNENKIFSIWIYHYWLNDNTTLLVTAEHKASGFVISEVKVKQRLIR